MRTWTFADHRPPGIGPWNDEPDKAQWIDEETGLDCLAVRNPHAGNWCGYVGVPPGHPWHGKDYGDVHDADPEIDVHGGLTFAGACQDGAEDGPGICHVPEPGRPAHVWWLGFDCAHWLDLSPTSHARIAEIAPELVGRPRPGYEEVYRTLDYVRQEAAGLARRAAAVPLAQ